MLDLISSVSLFIYFEKPKCFENHDYFCLRPYHPECTRSNLILEDKQGRAWLVLGWENHDYFSVLPCGYMR